MSLDLAALRARHAAVNQRRGYWFNKHGPLSEAHADRGALLAALDAMTQDRDAVAAAERERCARWHDRREAWNREAWDGGERNPTLARWHETAAAALRALSLDEPEEPRHA